LSAPAVLWEVILWHLSSAKNLSIDHTDPASSLQLECRRACNKKGEDLNRLHLFILKPI